MWNMQEFGIQIALTMTGQSRTTTFRRKELCTWNCVCVVKWSWRKNLPSERWDWQRENQDQHQAHETRQWRDTLGEHVNMRVVLVFQRRGCWKEPWDRRWRDTVLWVARRRIRSSDRRKNRGSCHSIPRQRIPERVVAQIVNMALTTHTQSGGENHQRFSISRNELRTLRKQMLCQDTIQQWIGEQVANKHVHQVVNSAEAKRSKIIKKMTQSRGRFPRSSRAEKESDHPGEHQSGEQAGRVHPRSSWRSRVRSLDPTTIKQAKINQFTKHVEILVVRQRHIHGHVLVLPEGA